MLYRIITRIGINYEFRKINREQMKESSKMKVYTETLICNTNAKLAWEALKNMNL